MEYQPQQGIHDARTLGYVKFGVLGIQHLFAMFGATILVPVITGLNVSVTLLFAGLGTLIFHFISKWKVPAVLGSSFAFIGGYLSIKELGMDKGLPEYLSLDYACIGVACAGLCYFIIAGLIKLYGTKRVLSLRFCHYECDDRLAAGTRSHHRGRCQQHVG